MIERRSREKNSERDRELVADTDIYTDLLDQWRSMSCPCMREIKDRLINIYTLTVTVREREREREREKQK